MVLIQKTGIATPPAVASDGFDTVLGSRANRYLGLGHTLVRHDLADVTSSPDLSTFSAIAAVAYPADWSVKNGANRDPHLSTIDAMHLAGVMRDRIAAYVPWAALGSEESLTVRAGSRPWSDLAQVPVKTSLKQIDGGVAFRSSAGSLHVDSTWSGTTQAQKRKLTTQPQGIAVSGLHVQDDVMHCDCVREDKGPVDFVDALLIAAQMAQVIVYSSDPNLRSSSGNMWMRRATFTRRPAVASHRQRVELAVSDRRLLRVGDALVESVNVRAANIFGVEVTASLAFAN